MKRGACCQHRMNRMPPAPARPSFARGSVIGRMGWIRSGREVYGPWECGTVEAMIRSITLQNFKSFGVKQTVHLEPISVLVGPNNSGKSNLMSVGQFVMDCVLKNVNNTMLDAGFENVRHRPSKDGDVISLGWKSDEGRYWVDFVIRDEKARTLMEGSENLDGSFSAAGERGGEPFQLIHRMIRPPIQGRGIWQPLMKSRMVHLSLDALRQDAQFVVEPRLTGSGSDMAAVVAFWRGAFPGKAAQLDEFLQKCLPELKFVLARPSQQQGLFRLWVEQKNGERFDARRISDGVLCFIGLAMHIIDAEPGAILFVEEPERSIHPQRLHDLVELMRTASHERKCQFILSTHSPVLLDAFRDEPEAIVLFRRSETPDQSTLVRRMTELPALMRALGRAQPGEMLETGLFSENFQDLEA